MKGKKVHEDVSLTVSPSTRQIFRKLMDEGIIAELIDSGVYITEICCGTCCGIGQAPTTSQDYDGISLGDEIEITDYINQNIEQNNRERIHSSVSALRL